MEYAVYKFFFSGGVHFGERTLESANMTFAADRLFSALAFEAKAKSENTLNEFIELVKTRKILFSDSFPFANDELFCPKPLMKPPKIEKEEDVAKRKIFKKIEYIPLDKFYDYTAGKAAAEELENPKFGDFSVKTSVVVEPTEDPLPYRIKIFSFKENCGLYALVGYEDKNNLLFVEDLLDALSFSGIGGKRSAGLGRFELKRGNLPPKYLSGLTDEYKTYMTLSAALPKDEELESVLKDANYLLEKKSGFIASTDYADEWRKKKDCYAFKTGSCFKKKFYGQLKDVANGGKHSVYRYLEPIFMGVE